METDHDQPMIPYIAYEDSVLMAERTMKRLVIALIAAIILMFASNAAWLYAWMQYDYVSDTTSEETITVDGKEGIANYIVGNSGSIVNGEGDKEKEDHYDTE